MRPRRQVRRTAVRPSYTRNSARPPRRPSSLGGSRAPQGSRLRLPSVRIGIPAVQTAWIRWMAIMTVILAILVVAAQATRLTKLQIEGNKNLNTTHVTQLAEQGAAKQWFGGNALAINTGALAGYLEDEEPAIKEAKVSHSGLQTLKIEIIERRPSLNWKSNNSVYLLDGDGTVIGPSVGEYTKLPTITDSTNLPVEEGKRVVPAAFIAFCLSFLNRIGEAGLQAESVSVPESTSELWVKTTKGYTLKLDTTRSVESTITALKTVQNELTRTKKTPKEYIDLRIESKAYYK